MVFEDFEQELHSALTHLFDPGYEPAEMLYQGAGCDPKGGAAILLETIVREIEAVKPQPDVPADGRPWRDYHVLHHRFVLGLSQLEVAERMAMSVRSVQRAQREAIHVLARRLWERRVRDSPEARRSIATAPQGSASEQPTEWRTQLQQELARLQKSSMGLGAPLRDAVEVVMRIAQASLKHRDVALHVVPAGLDLRLRIHPVVLRQILLVGIQELAQVVAKGSIRLSAQQESDHVWVRLVGTPVSERQPLDVRLARELLAAQGGSIEVRSEAEGLALIIGLPAWQPPDEKATVLVIDDNPDMATVFEAYCVGTRYRVVGLDPAEPVFEAVKAHAPDVILLDVMLPEVDGWELLLRLRSDPQTKSVPVIICSVVTDERLALNLGATLYLRKPLYGEQLIAALDQVLSGAATTVSAGYSNSPEGC
jgi:CheY-like chemotaxis protein